MHEACSSSEIARFWTILALTSGLALACRRPLTTVKIFSSFDTRCEGCSTFETRLSGYEHVLPFLHGCQLVQFYATELVPLGVTLAGTRAIMAVFIVILLASGSLLSLGIVGLGFLPIINGFVRNSNESGVLLCV